MLHFWSLSIEEQLYVALPLVVAAAALVGRRSRAALAVGLGVLTVASVALTAALHDAGGSTSAAYFGTGTRDAELLVGALLAVAVAGGIGRRAERPTPAALTAVGAVGLAVVLWAWTTAATDDLALYRGGLAAHAVASAAVIAAATGPGPLATALGVRPLRALGRISYGVYLYHWPIFLWLTPERAGLGGRPLLVLRVALTLTVAALSFTLLEQPVRTRRWRPRVPLPALAGGAAAAIALAAVVTTASLAPATVEAAAVEGLPAPVVDLPAGAPRVAILGDSTALMTGWALGQWGPESGRFSVAGHSARIGCGLGRGGDVDYQGEVRATTSECDTWPEEWGRLVREGDVDLAVVQIGPWDVSDRRLAGGDRWRHVGDPVYDAYLRDELRAAVDVLTAAGAEVLWLTSPRIDLGRQDVPPPSEPHRASDPARMARLNTLIREVAAERPQLVDVGDLAGHLAGLPGGELDARLRPDGVHFTMDTSFEVAEWLGPIIARSAEDAASA